MQRGKEVEQYDDEKKVALLAQKACGQDHRFSSDCRDNAPHCAGLIVTATSGRSLQV